MGMPNCFRFSEAIAMAAMRESCGRLCSNESFSL